MFYLCNIEEHPEQSEFGIIHTYLNEDTSIAQMLKGISGSFSSNENWPSRGGGTKSFPLYDPNHNGKALFHNL